MTGHAQLKFVMTECSKTEIRLTGLIVYAFLSISLFNASIVFNTLTFLPVYRQGVPEPEHDKTNKMTCTRSEDSEQPG